MLSAHQAMQTSVRNQVDEPRLVQEGAVRRPPPAASASAAIALGVFGIFAVGAWVLWIAAPAAADASSPRGAPASRCGAASAPPTAGRSCDQVEGFRTYLATAEADQLRFEEGEDIFSKYLPWAIVFELADRWAKICGDLVAMGRLPNDTPYWYAGNYNMAAFNTGFLTSSLTSAATPAPVGGQQRHRLRRRQLVRRRRLLRRRRRRRRRRQLVIVP